MDFTFENSLSLSEYCLLQQQRSRGPLSRKTSEYCSSSSWPQNDDADTNKKHEECHLSVTVLSAFVLPSKFKLMCSVRGGGEGWGVL